MENKNESEYEMYKAQYDQMKTKQEDWKLKYDELKDVIAAFVKVARHVRNYPHPNLPIEQLRAEAVMAEVQAEQVLGSELYATINELAFKD